MRLSADAIVLIFNRRFREVGQSLLCRFDRARQHKSQRMEKAHLRFIESRVGGQFQRLTHISQKHVGALHLCKRGAVSFGDGLFHQALLQADAKVPVIVLMMYLASSGERAESSSRTKAFLAAAPRLAAI